MRVLRDIVAPDPAAQLIFSEYAADLQSHTFSILRHLAVPKPDYSEAARLKLPGSRVVVALSRICVLFSVEFDDQPRSDAAEIGNEGVDRNLSAEFPSVELSILEYRPEPLLGFCGIAPECAGTSKGSLRDQSWRREVGHRWTISRFAGDVKWQALQNPHLPTAERSASSPVK